jgi:hypothetical protein
MAHFSTIADRFTFERHIGKSKTVMARPSCRPVNGHCFLPTGGQLIGPLVASKTAR